MATATITSKGQVTIPVRVRAALSLGAGDRVEFVELEKGLFAIIPSTHSVQDLKGMIRRPAKPVSVEDMNAATAAQGAAAQ